MVIIIIIIIIIIINSFYIAPRAKVLCALHLKIKHILWSKNYEWKK